MATQENLERARNLQTIVPFSSGNYDGEPFIQGTIYAHAQGALIPLLTEEQAQRVAVEFDAVALAAGNEALEKAAQVARNTPFRAHAEDDVDYHSGCEQTQQRIVAAIRVMKGAKS